MTDAYLIAFAFASRPLFRIGYGHHVLKWREHMQEKVWQRYWTDKDFRKTYDEIVEARRRQPMPEWQVRSAA